MGTPNFTDDVFQWARFCNDIDLARAKSEAPINKFII